MSKIKYINFKPFPERNTICEIETDKHCYDMHSGADFLMTIYNTEELTADLIWEYPSKWLLNDKGSIKDDKKYMESNDIEKKVRLIALKFNNVIKYEVIPRDPEMPFTEDNCLLQILTYDDDTFNEDILVFEFQSGLRIKIEAEQVVFDRDYKLSVG